MTYRELWRTLEPLYGNGERAPLPTMCWMSASDCRRLTFCAEPLMR